MLFKTFLLMKWFVLLMLIFLLSAHAKTLGQRAITLTEKNAPLEKVFADIQKISGYSIWYDKNILAGANPVDFHVVDASVEQVMDACCHDQPITYTIVGKMIAVKAKEKTIAVSSATMDVRGKVTDEKNNPLAGSTITVRDRARSTVSADDGSFEITNVGDDAVLEVSHVGYETLEVPVAKQVFVTIRLHLSVSKLDEVQVIGYGTTTKKLNTGSVSTITSTEIAEQSFANPLESIQGRAAGVFVVTSNGLPGANVNILIRGQNSIAAGNNPLYIVDGVPFVSTPLNGNDINLQAANGAISPFASLNPADIESIEILKDADATAIYGSRGANGVILISTKKGKPGKIIFTVNAYTGGGKVTRFIPMLNTPQFLALRRNAFQNDNVIPNAASAPDLLVWDTTKYTNWQKLLAGNIAPVTDLQSALSGGNEFIRFLISGNYRNEGTVYLNNTGSVRAGGRANIDFNDATKRFGGTVDFSYSALNNNIISNYDGLIFYNLPPNYPLYDSTGQLYWGGGKTNPLAYLKQKAKDNTNNLITNLQLHYAVLKNLNLKLNAGYTKIDLNQVLTYPKSSQDPNTAPMSYSLFGDNASQAFIVEPQAEFSGRIARGKFQILAGGTWENNTTSGYFLQANNYSNEALMESLTGASAITNYYSTATDYKYISFFGRVNYNWKDSYIINASFRRDGSSRFGENNQFGNFGAIGAAWIFIKSDNVERSGNFLSFGKLRASYGVTGNDQIPDYQYLSTYGAAPVYDGIAGLQPLRVANPSFGWEVTKKAEAAVNMGFFKNRLLLNIAGYRNRSDNELINYPLPTQTGFNGYQANLPAVVQNQGLEFELTTTNIKNRNFSWSTSFNLSLQQNKLLSFPNLGSTSYADQLVIGKSLSVVKGYHFTGVDPKTGAVQFEDVNKDGQITDPEDFVVIGKTLPDYFGGMTNTITLKKFELDVFFQFVKQMQYGLGYTSTFPPGYSRNNYPVTALKRWMKPGDITDESAASTTFGTPVFDAFFINYLRSDRGLDNASYMRLKTISISYSLLSVWSKKLHISDLKIFIQAQNLFTITNRFGLDPEVTDIVLPPLKTITAGLKVSF